MRRILIAAGLAVALGAGYAGGAAAMGSGGGSSGASTAKPMEKPKSAAASIGDVKRQVEAGDYAKAIETADKVLEAQPQSADAYNYIGYANRKLGKTAAAEEAYQQALAIDPNHVGAHEYYGELKLEQGDVAAAEQHLAALQRICGDCTERRTLWLKIAGAKS